MRIRRIKKIVVILIIMAMLQTQIVSITNIAWALTAGIEEGALGTELGEQVETETTVEEVPKEEPQENVVEEPEEELQENVEEEPKEEPQENVEEEPKEQPQENVEEEPEEEPQENVEEVPEEELSTEVEDVVEPKIELNITSENSSIYKGYLYANATSDLRYETKYSTIEEIKIQGSKNGITNLVVKEEEDKIKLITDTKMALFNDIYYKKMKVSVEEFNTILGETGIINVLDADGDFVGYIDSKSPVEDGYYVYNFVYYTNSVRYELSNPIADGTIRILNEKAIKEDSLYSREQIETFSTINVMASAEMTVGENVLRTESEGDISLQETESKVEIELDKTELSTEEENEMIIILTLRTDAEKYELFKNPVMEIEMPTNVNDVSIEGINLLYRNGLSLKNWEVVENDNGNKVLRVELDGAQSVYTPGVAQEGTTVVLYSRVNVNKLTANTSEALKLRYTNEDSTRQAYVLEGKSAEEIKLAYVAKHGMLKGLVATNNKTADFANSYEDEVDKIEVKSKITDQVVTIKGTVVNNFEKDANDVVIIGRIPFVGNKNGNGEDLQSTFDTILNSEVLTSGNITEIYYSEDGEAGKDAETWSQDVTDMSKYKSFKIVVKEGTLKNGERIEFTFDVKVADNLGFNLKSYATYTIMYKLDNQELSGNSTIALVTEEKELEADDLENKEEVAELKIATQVSQGGRILTEEDTVYERQILRYTVVVTNPSNVAVTNIKLTGRAENANMYTWKYMESSYGNGGMVREYLEDTDGTRSQDEMIVERLEPGESKTFEYQVISKELPVEIPEDGVSVHGIITIVADNIEEQNIQTIKNKVVDGELELRVGWAGTESIDGKTTMSNSEFPIYVYMKNLSDNDLKNVKLNVMLPSELDLERNKGLNIVDADGFEIEMQKVTEGTNVIFTIPTLSSKTERTIYLKPHANSMDYSIEKNNILITAIGQTETNSYYSNDYTKAVYQGETKLEHTWIGSVNKEIVEHNEEIIYELLIKNTGLIDTGLLTITGDLPRGLKVDKIVLTSKGTEREIEPLKYENGDVAIQVLDVKAEKQSEVLLIITTKVDENYFQRDQETVDLKLNVFGGRIDGFETDVISYKINNKNVTFQEPEVEEPDDEEIENPSDEDIDIDNLPDEEPEIENPNDDNVNDEPVDEPIEDNTPNDNPVEEKPSESETPEVEIPDETEDSEIEETDKVIKTYNISGKVWLDKNKDGINKNEEGMQSVVVILYKTTAKGNITSKAKDTITDKNGEYKFTGVEEGTYVVVFNYDTSLYNSTKYKVSTATSIENSDAITKAVSVDGGSQVLGITDVITIKGAGATNVDLGLVSKNEFDLELDKYIEKAVVTNGSGTKTYNYQEKESVKLEIHSKNFKNSKIDITYKIRIKNVGEVTGYVNKIADYVPEGMKFDNNKNPDWYYGDDGSLYYKGLIGQEIKAGETKEISLTLTKTLENGEATKVVNAAEIAESTNSMGLTDMDSTPGNKNGKEDDYGKVSLIIAISTGKAVDNILIVILAVSTVVIIVYIAKFKTSKKVYR